MERGGRSKLVSTGILGFLFWSRDLASLRSLVAERERLAQRKVPPLRRRVRSGSGRDDRAVLETDQSASKSLPRTGGFLGEGAGREARRPSFTAVAAARESRPEPSCLPGQRSACWRWWKPAAPNRSSGG